MHRQEACTAPCLIIPKGWGPWYMNSITFRRLSYVPLFPLNSKIMFPFRFPHVLCTVTYGDGIMQTVWIWGGPDARVWFSLLPISFASEVNVWVNVLKINNKTKQRLNSIIFFEWNQVSIDCIKGKNMHAILKLSKKKQTLPFVSLW